MKTDFAAFILTHGRADRVYTYETLKKHGYTGKIYIVIDDEDAQADEYRKRYGDKVLMFSKSEIAKTFDEGDNFNDRRAIIYARNACWNLAKQAGVRYFIQLDDDYMTFHFKFNEKWEYISKNILSLDGIFNALVAYYKKGPFCTIAMSQGGDHIGGVNSIYNHNIGTKRKAMNTFICDAKNPFHFIGRVNEDVNTYTSTQRAGRLFLTIMGLEVMQRPTQSNAGGMTEMYKESGTYIKSFYTVMYAPSCAKIKNIVVGEKRLHHLIDWNACAPCIIREEHRKARRC